MNKIHQLKISNFLSHLDIENLAIKTGFCIRAPRKITTNFFLLSFFNVMLKKCYSLRQWSSELSFLTGQPISFQAIAKRLQIRQLPFLKALLLRGLEAQLNRYNDVFSDAGLFPLFNRILIQDSSCIKLPDSLSEYFPGSVNQYGKKKAIARVQLCIDLKSNAYRDIDLKSYCNHDGTYADKILDYIEHGDLILRDLGYSITRIFRQIDNLGAYFISRLHVKWCVLDTENEEVIDLVGTLKKLDQSNTQVLDKEVKIGKNEKLKVRLVSIKLTEQQAQKRRAQARKNGNRNKKGSKSTSYLLGWNIFITNIDQDQLSVQKVYKFYSLRWHIELIFKNWKSHFRINEIFTSCQGKNYAKPELLFYLCMCFLVLIYNPRFIYFQKLIADSVGRILSPIKFSKLIMNHPEVLFQKESFLMTEIIKKNCCYSLRKDRKNIYEKLLYN